MEKTKKGLIVGTCLTVTTRCFPKAEGGKQSINDLRQVLQSLNAFDKKIS